MPITTAPPTMLSPIYTLPLELIRELSRNMSTTDISALLLTNQDHHKVFAHIMSDHLRQNPDLASTFLAAAQRHLNFAAVSYLLDFHRVPVQQLHIAECARYAGGPEDTRRQMLRLLLSRNGTPHAAVASCSPLAAAIESGCNLVVSLLLAAGADIHGTFTFAHKDNEETVSALTYAFLKAPFVFGGGGFGMSCVVGLLLGRMTMEETREAWERYIELEGEFGPAAREWYGELFWEFAEGRVGSGVEVVCECGHCGGGGDVVLYF